jgi:Asp/Glu/hydantoin racemase
VQCKLKNCVKTLTLAGETPLTNLAHTTHPRIALIHAVSAAMPPIHSAFKEHWAEANCTNLFDDGLPAALESAGNITPDIQNRIDRLARHALLNGAEGILFTCSAFAPAIEAVARELPIPVLKPDEAMFEQALSHGARIGMIATFEPAIASMEAAFLQKAREAGRNATIQSVYVPHALDASKRGELELHNRLVCAALPQLQHCDAIILAQFSTSTALPLARQSSRVPVLSAPEAAVRFLRNRLQNTIQ